MLKHSLRACLYCIRILSECMYWTGAISELCVTYRTVQYTYKRDVAYKLSPQLTPSLLVTYPILYVMQ